jgi:tetratricopeptide (TPR) repeat protein
VSEPGDRSEQEADRLADRVLRMPEREQAGRPLAAPQALTDAPAWPGAGTALPPATRAFFEPRFGHDFSRLRIHADAEAADVARALNADAFTIGRDIVFGAGRYAPDTSAGRRLLAHELAHVVQPAASGASIQRQKAAQPTAADIAEVEQERKRFEEAKKKHQEAMQRAKDVAAEYQARLDFRDAEARFAKARERHLRAVTSPQPTDALQKAGITTRRIVDTKTGDLMDVVLRQSNIMRRYLSTKIKIAGGKFIIENSDSEFDTKYRALNDVKPGSEEWNNTSTVRGFYHRATDTIHLRPRSDYGQAVHESIHKFANHGFREMFGGFIDEGVTQYFADMVLEEQGLEKGHTLYDENLKCARKLIKDVANFGLVARNYFDGDATLTNMLLRRYGASSRQLVGNSEEWCKRFGV